MNPPRRNVATATNAGDPDHHGGVVLIELSLVAEILVWLGMSVPGGGPDRL